MDTKALFERWRQRAVEDPELDRELDLMDPVQIEDAFGKDLTFGTAGLRGILGAGTNRMNVYVVARASQAVASYLEKEYPGEEKRVIIGYDCRIKSDLFARTAAEVFAAAGIQVYLFPELIPTPCVSFGVRELKCAAGINITASHNPAEYNGYKVYGADGGQITETAAEAILQEVQRIDIFDDVKRMDYEEAVGQGRIRPVPPEVMDSFMEAVKKTSMLREEDGADKGVPIVFTPLNGTGLKPVMRVLAECGYTNVRVVPEQELPDGHFTTCPKPNPENPEALELGVELAKKIGAGLVLATDPDCDRVGIAAESEGEFLRLDGNQIGVLLLDYLCTQHRRRGTMPQDPVMIKSIVSTGLAGEVASGYDVGTIDVLTGFKYIGEQIGLLEAAGKGDSFLLGFEESCGYLSGTHARDKDGVNAALLICEMYVFHRSRGVSLPQRMEEIYRQYGYWLNKTIDITGTAPQVARIMDEMRAGAKEIGGRAVLETRDYQPGIDGLPPANMLKLELEDGSSVIVRPSGTEPKLKIYLAVHEDGREATEKTAAMIEKDIREKCAV